MYRRNPYINCPQCGASNKDSNWRCWKCFKNSGVVTELEEAGGAAPPWGNQGVVLGGALHSDLGYSAVAARRNPETSMVSQNLKLIRSYADKIYQNIPDGQGLHEWMEHFLSICSADMSDIVHALRSYEPKARNPKKKYMAKANARLIKSYASELIEMLHEELSTEDLRDWMTSKISAIANRLDSVWHAMEYKPEYAVKRNPIAVDIPSSVGLEFAKEIFNTNPDLVELNSGEDMHYDDHIEEDLDELANDDLDDEDELDVGFSEDEEIDLDDEDDDEDEIGSDSISAVASYYRRRKNPWRRNPCCCGASGCMCQCDGDAGRCGCKRSYRRNASAPWSKPLFRRNRLRRYRRNGAGWETPLFRRRNTAPSWGGPLFRRNAGAGWETPLFRRNSSPSWGGPLFHRRKGMRRRNAGAGWETPLFRRRHRSRRNPIARTARWAPCAGCGLATCGCGCGGDEMLCTCSGGGMRRNTAPAWGGPLYRRNGARMWGADGKFRRRRHNPFGSDAAWGGPLYRRRLNP